VFGDCLAHGLVPANVHCGAFGHGAFAYASANGLARQEQERAGIGTENSFRDPEKASEAGEKSSNRKPELTVGYCMLECTECGEYEEQVRLQRKVQQQVQVGFRKSCHIKTGPKTCSLSKCPMKQTQVGGARCPLPAPGGKVEILGGLFWLHMG